MSSLQKVLFSEKFIEVLLISSVLSWLSELCMMTDLGNTNGFIKKFLIRNMVIWNYHISSVLIRLSEPCMMTDVGNTNEFTPKVFIQ